MRLGISLTTKRTNFHEWGAASPENFIVGVIRVHSKNSWFKCLVPRHSSSNPGVRVHFLSFFDTSVQAAPNIVASSHKDAGSPEDHDAVDNLSR